MNSRISIYFNLITLLSSVAICIKSQYRVHIPIELPKLMSWNEKRETNRTMCANFMIWLCRF